jgi:hypothetical protein
MINEQPLDAKFRPPSPPLYKPKTEESLEIARLTQEFEAKGGKIKKDNANPSSKTDTFLVGDAFLVWPQREHILRLMRQKFISKDKLAAKTKLRLSLVSKFLAGEQLPDKQEREIILTSVENWGIKL